MTRCVHVRLLPPLQSHTLVSIERLGVKTKGTCLRVRGKVTESGTCDMVCAVRSFRISHRYDFKSRR